MSLIGRVAGEQLVAAVARECHGHRAAREAREQERRNQRGVTERLVQKIRQLADEASSPPGVQNLLVVLRTERLRHPVGVGRFVEGRLFEADRERLETAGSVPGSERRDGARVDPAGEKHTERYVTDQMLAYDKIEHAAEPLD